MNIVIIDHRKNKTSLNDIEIAIDSSGINIYSTECYKACDKRQIKSIIPPIKTAVQKTGEIFDARNQAIEITQTYSSYEEGVAGWKKKEFYGKRSHVEGFFFKI